MRLTKSKVLAIFSIFVLMMILNTILGAVTNFGPKYGTTTARVNFRTTPNTNSSSIIRTLSKGTQVKMVGEVSNFYIVQIGTNEIGYISKDYIKTATTAPKGASTYYMLVKYNAKTNCNAILRGGPSTSFRKITTLKSGTTVQVIGKISDFLLVVTENNVVGMIRNDLLTKTTQSTTTTTPSTSNNQTTTNITGTTNEELVLKLINEARIKNSLSTLKMDSKLLEIARLKAIDMVENDYFSHTSPSYSTPFKMMQNFGITYVSAGENIAGNTSIEAAVNSWLASETHKKNILSTSYNYAGIGVEKSDTYGYIIVAMFIQK